LRTEVERAAKRATFNKNLTDTIVEARCEILEKVNTPRPFYQRLEDVTLGLYRAASLESARN